MKSEKHNLIKALKKVVTDKTYALLIRNKADYLLWRNRQKQLIDVSPVSLAVAAKATGEL